MGGNKSICSCRIRLNSGVYSNRLEVEVRMIVVVESSGEIMILSWSSLSTVSSLVGCVGDVLSYSG